MTAKRISIIAFVYIVVLASARDINAQGLPTAPAPVGEAKAIPLPLNQRPAVLPGLAVKLATTLQPGDIIARGNRINVAPDGRKDGCQVNFGVETPRFSTGSYTIDMRADDDCVVRVYDIIDQTDAATTVQAAAPEPQQGVFAKLWRQLNDWFMPPLSAAFGTEADYWLYVDVRVRRHVGHAERGAGLP